MRKRTSTSQPQDDPTAESRGDDGGEMLDPTPPPDHEAFVELRSRGLQAVRKKLESRRRKR